MVIPCVFAVLVASVSAAQSAPTAYVPPTAEGYAKTAASLAALPRVVDYLDQIEKQTIFNQYAGKAKELQTQADNGPALQVGVGLEAGLSAAELFGVGAADEAGYSWVGSVQSVGAVSMRLCVDLLGLAEGEELYVVQPDGAASFGPYLAADALDQGLWLPTIEGDTVVLVVRSIRAELPPVHLERVSHFFEPVIQKQTCPVDTICAASEDVRVASTAVGRMVVTMPDGVSATCTGSLLNNPQTEVKEPYLITANHCFQGGARASGVEVFWDYKAAECGGAAPNLSTLPRSTGRSTLASSSRLDLEFLELSSVPDGSGGRAYLGWDVRAPIIGEPLLCIHHPRGLSMKLARGSVAAVEDTPLGSNQTKAIWNEGITERGSSGSPLLYVNSALSFLGVLSNGNTQSCSNDAERIDFYSSFRDFFPQIACHLTTDQMCQDAGGVCPAKAAFGADSLEVAQLRVFRDKVLMQFPVGRELVAAYYEAAPRVAQTVQRNSQARDFFVGIAAPVAALGGALE